MAKKLGTLDDWAKGDLNLEHFTEPSMVEPVHNLSIEEILRDYKLGITHSYRKGAYDDGEGLEPVDLPEDFVDFLPETHPLTFQDPSEVPEKETPEEKLPPAGEESVPENTNE